LPIVVGFAAAHAPITLGCVFSQSAVAGVVDADDDERLYFASLDGGIGVFADLPGASRNVRGAGVEQVLAILQIKNRVAAVRVFLIPWRQVDNDIALVGKNLARECAMKPQTGVQSGFAGGEQCSVRVRP
jgi:hypothetical protein